jgi:hypothetical protein
VSYISARLEYMADRLVIVENDRVVLRDAAYMLSERNMGEAAKMILVDKDALRAALEQLTSKQVGIVLALVLSRLDEAGDKPLPELLRVLASQVDELIETLED